MKTFTGQYSNGNFVYSNDTEAIRAQLISILNTPLGSRFYYPSYGSRLNDYRFDVINYFTINRRKGQCKPKNLMVYRKSQGKFVL